MKKKALFTVLILFTFTTVGLAVPSLPGTEWADRVVLFDQPAGSNNYFNAAGDNPDAALGAPDRNHIPIDVPEVLILAFTDNTAWNNPGYDIKVYQVVAGDSWIDVYASADNTSYSYLGTTNGDSNFDLGSLSYANYIKFVGLDNGGTAPGYDLDAVEALHSVAHYSNEGNGDPTVPVPGAGLLAGMGLGVVSWMRKRRQV